MARQVSYRIQQQKFGWAIPIATVPVRRFLTPIHSILPSQGIQNLDRHWSLPFSRKVNYQLSFIRNEYFSATSAGGPDNESWQLLIRPPHSESQCFEQLHHCLPVNVLCWRHPVAIKIVSSLMISLASVTSQPPHDVSANFTSPTNHVLATWLLNIEYPPTSSDAKNGHVFSLMLLALLKREFAMKHPL